jgi:hypothetical protein
MSEDNGVPTTSPVEQQMIPKERFDELIAQRRALESQNQVLQDVLRRAVPGQQRAPERDPEWLDKLKEENPSAYQAFKVGEQQKRQTNATLFTVMDGQDRLQFHQEFGDEAKKYASQVEAKLEELRQQNIHHWNRGQILVHLKGTEALTAAKAPRTPAAPVETPPSSNIPSSNPQAAGTTAGGSVPSASKAATIEELEERLKDVLI